MNGSASDPVALVGLVSRPRSGGYVFATVTPLTHPQVNGRAENARACDLGNAFGCSPPSAASLLPNGLPALMLDAGVLSEQDDALRATYREFDPDAYGEELDNPRDARVERIALVVPTAFRGESA